MGRGKRLRGSAISPGREASSGTTSTGSTSGTPASTRKTSPAPRREKGEAASLKIRPLIAIRMGAEQPARPMRGNLQESRHTCVCPSSTVPRHLIPAKNQHLRPYPFGPYRPPRAGPLRVHHGCAPGCAPKREESEAGRCGAGLRRLLADGTALPPFTGPRLAGATTQESGHSSRDESRGGLLKMRPASAA